MEFWGFMPIVLKFNLLYQQNYWIFYSVFCPHLIKIQKIIPETVRNSMNLRDQYDENMFVISTT